MNAILANLIFSRFIDDILAAFVNEQDSLNLLYSLNKELSNIKFTKVNHSIAFLYVFIPGIKVNRSVYIANCTYQFC